ncbi:MAG: EAL domain-containing protein [Micrococcales bacterium]|nr:EAL domain-containing protein [Micrococcales bacterium]
MPLSVPRFVLAGARAAAAPSWRVWTVMAAVSLVLPVGGLVVAGFAGDPRLLVVAVGQLVLVGVLVAVLLGLVRDRARHAGRATELAETDPVTGLANRQRFQADVTQALDAARDTVNVTVMLVALESFTELRARLGEATAENLQVAAARRLVAQASDALAVGHLHTDVVALLFDVMNSDRAGARAQHFVDVLREPIDLPQLSLSVGVVIGIATGQAGSTDAAGLLASAELALAAARGPAGPLVRFTPELERRDAMAAQLVGELSEAIGRGEVQAYFQPQLDLATGRVTGAEALVRWLHPSLGLLSPAAFVPAAEVTGTIRMITVHVLDLALYWGARWARAGRSLNVSVNLSARDLLHARLVDDVREALARYSMPASRLELEITETMAMADVALSRRVLTDLARLGVTISIDDYGTGYGSLAYLQQLPVRRLKIDRSFVSRILDDEASMAIVRSTIELAGQLGLDTVAEGVEDEATVQRLRAFGCGSVQGFGVAAPMSPEGFERAIWRLEHRPRPGVAAVRPTTAGHEVAAAARAAYPSVAQAYHKLNDPGWWTDDLAQAPSVPATVPPTDGPATAPAARPAPLPQVPQPAQGSPWSAPGGVRAPAPQPQPAVVQPGAAVQPAVVQPVAVPAARGWVPQRQRAVVMPDDRSGWPVQPSDRSGWPSTSDDRPDWPVAPEPDLGRPSRRERRHQRERGGPMTGADSVTGP